MNSFWSDLPKPFTILAPMEGVTDVVFRQIITEIGKPNVFFTEFVSCDGIMSRGREKVERSFKFNKQQQPIVAQIWGSNPKTFLETAKYCNELGFSGIDINMGCPDKEIIKKGSCSALINNHQLAKEIISATKEGAGGLPVSVKTRIGFEDTIIEEWISFLLKQNLAALSVHLRTVKDLSKVPANWDLMPKIIELRDKIAPKTLIIGNGDIISHEEVLSKYKKYKAEGYMIGRGVFANPWVFNSSIDINSISVSDRLNLYVHHIKLFESTWGDLKNPAELKKFSKTYINNFPDAAFLRDKLMLTKNTQEMLDIITEYKNQPSMQNFKQVEVKPHLS